MKARHWLVIFVVPVAAGGGWLLWKQREAAVLRALEKSVPRYELPGLSETLSQKLGAARLETVKNGVKPYDLGNYAKLLLANGVDEPAEQTLRLLLQRDAENALWPHLLSRLLAGYGRLDEALPLMAKTVALSPDYLPARLQWGESLLKQNQVDKARTVFDDVLKQEPKNPYARLGLARIALQGEKWDEAETQLKEASAADPTFSLAYALLSTVAEKKGDMKAAEYLKMKASSLGRFRDFDDPWSDSLNAFCFEPYRLRVLAAAKAAVNRREEAVAYWEKAYNLDPKNGKLCHEIGVNFLKMEKLPEAELWLKRATELAPTEAAAYIDLIGIYKAKHDRTAGAQLLEAGLKQCPRSAGIHYEYAMLQLANGVRDGVTEHLSLAVQLEPENLSAYYELAAQHFRERDSEGGLKVLQAALSRQPEDATALLMLGKFHVMAGHKKEGRDYLRHAVKVGMEPEVRQELEKRFEQRFGEKL